jgi:signal peptidase
VPNARRFKPGDGEPRVMSGDDGRPSGDRSGGSEDRSIDGASGRDGGVPDDERGVSEDTSDDGVSEDTSDDGVSEDTSDGESAVDARRGPTRHSAVQQRAVSNASDTDRETRRSRYSEVVSFLRELLTSVAAVVLVGLLLFAISGVWPPMVAVESGSMEPVMHRGDLVFITEPGRYAPNAAYDGTGVVTVDVGKEVGYTSFGGPGSVVVYDQPGLGGSPIIHRAHFWVAEGENWYDRANPDYVSAANCAQLNNCPAPHAGFVTKGDANARYDQANGISDPVKPEWITGIARLRVPYLGLIRLSFGTMLQTATVDAPVTAHSTESVEVPATVSAQTAGESRSQVGVANDSSRVGVANDSSRVAAVTAVP